MYAHDKDIYIGFKPKPENVSRVVQITENCLTELRIWFVQNFLQPNDDKTIFIVIGSRFKLLPEISYIQVGELENAPSATAANLGVTFDEHMTMLFGLPHCLLQKLEYVQIAAARLIAQKQIYDHVTHIKRALY